METGTNARSQQQEETSAGTKHVKSLALDCTRSLSVRAEGSALIMGNMVKALRDVAQTTMGPVHTQENVLLQELSELSEVELCRVHWGLSQDLVQGSPPIPPRWLQSADACRTMKTMLKCYQEDGALMVLAAVLSLIGLDDRVSFLHCTARPPRPRPGPKPDPDFVKTRRRRLISRIQMPDAILDALQGHGILNTTNRDAVSIYAVRKHKNRALVDLVMFKGDEAQKVFHQALSESEPFLLQELEDEPISHKNASETSVLRKMLELLVSDELRSFQWLVSGHMTGENCFPIGGEHVEHEDRATTQRLLEENLGFKEAERVATPILLKIVPTLRVCLQGEAVTSEISSDITVETTAPQVAITSEVREDGDMFRLRCRQPGVSRCSLTSLLLEGFGDVVYEMVPWDVDFLSSKGLRPAGPLFRFTLLTGSFHRLHLPHCQLLSDGCPHFLSVAHVTGDFVAFITPSQVTDSHVIVDISGFSCFGLVMPAASSDAISGLVLLFSQPTDASLFVLLLPRNVCLTQVRRAWKRRSGAEYVEAIPDCELIPNQTYKLSGRPVTIIQPESSKFINFSDYNNFLPSFQVQLPDGVTKVWLQLSRRAAPIRLIGWLFGSTEHKVWMRVIQLRGSVWMLGSDSVEVTLQLLQVLNQLGLEDLRTFQHFLSLQSDPISVCRLENADRKRTVDLMVQQYHTEGAQEVTEEILRRMNYNQLADDSLQRR